MLEQRVGGILFWVLIVLASPSIFAQSSRAAQPFDTWGRVHGESASARLDNFAIQLLNEPGATGYVICYGPAGEGSGTGNFIIKVMMEYLVNTRGIDQDQLKMVYGGRYHTITEPFIQAFIVSAGAPLPEPAKYDPKVPQLRGKLREWISSDDYTGVDECGCGPPQGDVEMAGIADAFGSQVNDLIYVVAYNLPSSAPGTWRRVAEMESKTLQGYGIAADRIKVIFGGTAKPEKDDDPSVSDAKIELWALPSNADPPVKAAVAEPTPTEAMKLGSYELYFLADADEQKRVLARIADVFEHNRDARICFIARPATPSAPDPEVPSSADLTKVDLLKLVDGWKQELIGKSKADDTRVLVIPATGDEENEGTVEVWLLPPGTSVPDPYALKPGIDY